MTPTPEREALAAAIDRLIADGFQRQEDWLVKNEGEEFEEQIHVDTIALIAASPAAGGEREALTDEQIIKRCSEAGIQWLVPDADPDEFPGGFDMCGMAEMRKLLAATPPAAPAPASDEREAVCYIHRDMLAELKARGLDDSQVPVRYANGFPSWVPPSIREQYIPLALAARAPQAAAPQPTVQAEAVQTLRERIREEFQLVAGLGRSACINSAMLNVDALISALSAPPVGEPVQRRVRKTGGSFQHTGTVVAEFKTLAGQPRIVLEFDEPVAGMLHVYRPDQVEPLDAAPSPSAPAGEGEKR